MAKGPSVMVFLTLCIIHTAIAGEYEVSQISAPHLEHEDIGEGYEHTSFDHAEESSLENYEGEHHVEDIGNSLSDYHGANGATSYVKVNHDGDKEVSYAVDHSGYIGGSESYGDGGIGAETNHIYESHVQGDGAGTGAVSSSSYKDYTGKGSSYSVHQSHGHQGSASITTDHSSSKDHIQTTVYNSQSQGHGLEFDLH
ncbi:hypothetical protein O3M35_003254 [Rhynocoris fuscipes]|uniref:Uncharacterized protein n=1 Tax=Rhynocoris fuscipes TaxID=488301 RepID=A0AAW1CMD1_9HEMI